MKLTNNIFLNAIAMVCPVAVVGLALAGSASADTLKSYTVAGTFNATTQSTQFCMIMGPAMPSMCFPMMMTVAGASMSGTLTVDTTTGVATKGSVSVNGNSFVINPWGPTLGGGLTEIALQGTSESLALIFNTADLSSKTISLCSTTKSCFESMDSQYRGNGFTENLQSGTLSLIDSTPTSTPNTATPEPSTNAMMGAGLAIAAFAARKRLSK